MNEIEVYVASTDALKERQIFETCYQYVSKERRKKVDSFRFQKDKMLSLAAGVLLEKALRKRGISEWDMHHTEHGKPYVDGICFNLSHSEERVMCVVSEHEIGCDVEKITDIDLEIARQFFFSTEYEKIRKKETVVEQTDMFFRLWTLKESFMKATGLGMMLSLDAFRIDISDEDEIRVCHNVNEKEYQCKEYHLEDGYKYAICGEYVQSAKIESNFFVEFFS